MMIGHNDDTREAVNRTDQESRSSKQHTHHHPSNHRCTHPIHHLHYHHRILFAINASLRAMAK
eukprot:768432-Hanusia_phi.AAC.9